MKIEITNQQKLKTLDLKKIQSIVKKIFKLLSQDKRIPKIQNIVDSTEISFLFCDNNCIKKLNKRFFKKNIPTDVIAFPLTDELDPNYLGEVVVSVEEAVKTAKILDINWQREIILYVLHGILHLVGYSDTTRVKKVAMDKKQNEIIDKIRVK